MEGRPFRRLIAVKRCAKRYCAIYSNDTFVPINDQNLVEDPLSNDLIQISKGVLSIGLEVSYSLGGWNATNLTYRFRLKGREMILIGYDATPVNRASGSVTSYSANLLTRRFLRTEGRTDRDGATISRGVLPKGPEVSMSRIDHALSYQPAGLLAK
jgi:hypothetical protein